MTYGNALVFADNDFATLGGNVKARGFATHTLWHQFELDGVFGQVESIKREEILEDLLIVVAQRFQQYRHWHFTAAVNAEIQIVFGVVFKIEPRAAIRNHAR